MQSESPMHTVLLLFSVFLTLFWVNSEVLAGYSLQLTAGLIIFLVSSHKIFKLSSFLMVESLVSTISVLLISSATGGLTSPFFFLNHFLLFELSMLLEPVVSVTLTLGLLVFYLFSNQTGTVSTNLIILGSFVFMTPLAYITGKIYTKVKNSPLQTIQVSSLS